VHLWKAADVPCGEGLRLRAELCVGEAEAPGAVESPFSAEYARASVERALWESRQAHRKACTKLWIILSNSGSCFRRSSIFRIE